MSKGLQQVRTHSVRERVEKATGARVSIGPGPRGREAHAAGTGARQISGDRRVHDHLPAAWRDRRVDTDQQAEVR